MPLKGKEAQISSCLGEEGVEGRKGGGDKSDHDITFPLQPSSLAIWFPVPKGES